ncbi:phage scaffolding protein [Paenibacillus sp. FSL R5-0407]|uniref:phage scaffolding protein n=1 Tax=Paenibacillus sp. FSL R5-0407 TaxID=2975320 RepID=UPI0030FCAF5D
MDWLKELLKKLGVAEAEVEKIDAEVRKELPMHFVPKSQYNEVAEAKKKAEKDVTDRDKQLEDLKKSSGDADTLKQQIQKLQEDNKTASEKYESDLKELRLGNALKLALAGQVHDADLVTGLIDKTKIELGEDGSIKAGLEDQIKGLRESKAFLFAENKPTFKGANPADPNSQTNTSTLSDASTISNIFAQQ